MRRWSHRHTFLLPRRRRVIGRPCEAWSVRYDNALGGGNDSIFPLSVAANGRYFEDAQGNPFFIHGDHPWSIVNNLTPAERETYFDDAEAKGFNAAWIGIINRYASDNSPKWANENGDQPFETDGEFDAPVEAYWSDVDDVINEFKARDMVVLAQVAYWGNEPDTREEGWDDEIMAASDAQLIAYGEFLGNRYQQGNIIWVDGGDWSLDATERAKTAKIMEGIRNIQPNALYTAHAGTNSNSRDVWDDAVLDMDLVYKYEANGRFMYEAIDSYDLSPSKPVIAFEGQFEGSGDAAMMRRIAYTGVLSGACGHFYGNSLMWHFGDPDVQAGDWTGELNAEGRADMPHVKALFTAYEWWKLEPKTDTSLVSSSLGTGTGRICPALASDNSFALVWIPSSQSVTVVMSALAPSSVRARLYNPMTGAYTAVSGSPFANTGTQNIASGGERILVLDAA